MNQIEGPHFVNQVGCHMLLARLETTFCEADLGGHMLLTRLGATCCWPGVSPYFVNQIGGAHVV